LKTPRLYSDPELIALLRSRDPQACAYLYDRYAGAIQGFISQVIPQKGDQLWVLQKTFVAICDNIGNYDPSKFRLFTWMMHLARKIALNRISEQHIPGAGEVTLNSGPQVLTKRLSSADEEIIQMSWFKGYTAEEIARHLGIPADQAKQKIRNALIQLRTIL
jgi:DNA-directed RNA polymerase specialized sigma24 family protein